jgi:hypothetical protein
MGRAGVVVFALRASRWRWVATAIFAQSGRFWLWHGLLWGVAHFVNTLQRAYMPYCPA